MCVCVCVCVYVCVCVIMKTMRPAAYHRNGFVATHALVGNSLCGHMCRTSCAQAHGLHKANVVITGRAHCFHDYICITPILLL